MKKTGGPAGGCRGNSFFFFGGGGEEVQEIKPEGDDGGS